MAGHYLRVQEAASLLGVAPTTIRWYCAQGWLLTYWVGRGQVGHRRFLYADVEELGNRLGRVIPPEKDWSAIAEWDVSLLAQYLGLSTKFLSGTGVTQTGDHLNWEKVQAVEQAIYGAENQGQKEAEDEDMSMEERKKDKGFQFDNQAKWQQHGVKHGPGFNGGPHQFPHGFRSAFGGAGRRAMEAWGNGSDWFDLEHIDPTNLLALRRALRHLETRKLDLEDQIAELKKKIQTHPDYEED